MLKSIRLRNFRSFSELDTQPFVELKPLSIFVGKNSSGKSSLLRALPLLRQSVEARTTGPILWYGNYVDFGAFSEVKKHDSSSQTVFFDFKLESAVNRKYFRRGLWFDRNIERYGSDVLDAQIELGVTDADKKTIAKSLKIHVCGFEYLFEIDSVGYCTLSLDGAPIKGIDSKLFTLSQYNFLPMIGRIKEVEQTIDGNKRPVRKWDENYLNEFFSQLMINKLRPYFHSNTSLNTIESGIDQIGFCERDQFEVLLKRVYRDSTYFIKRMEHMPLSVLDSLYALCIHKSLQSIISISNQELEGTFKNIKYIAPLRSTAERYYRHQDLQVEEIDHTGSNLAMLLRSWSVDELNKFAKWTLDSFGFSVRVEEDGLHYALKIKTDYDNKEYNINDMGFGFSQILPIVTSIWLETSVETNRIGSTAMKKQLIFAIEQPELHLHPEYQAKLASAFASMVNEAADRGINLIILFETHSRTMVETIGDKIEDGIISKEQVSIVLFEKELSDSSTHVDFAKFDENGALNNWPIGFFSGRK